MRRIILRPKAQDDISSIWDYSAERWDVDQADAYISAIRAALQRVATHPQIGSNAAILRRGLRRFNAGSHAIFYLHGEESVDIVRVLHQRMQPDGKL